jgi:hypothetical protein
MHVSWFFIGYSSALLAASDAAYIGAKACARCHASEFRQQSNSEHARSLYATQEHPLKNEFAPTGSVSRGGGYQFRFSNTPEGFLVTVFDDKNRMDIPMDWAFGAGAQAVTFVSRIDEHWYLEHFLTYYPSMHRVSITPGQHDIRANSLAEAAGLVYKALDPEEGIVRCFECHSTGPVNTAGGMLRPSQAGVHCEACHGPGSGHAKTSKADAIANPGRLTAAELNELCGRCHRAPAAQSVQIDWAFAWNVRHQPVYLSRSTCFQRSNGALSCLACHNSHGALQREASYYNGVCVSCHEAAHSGAAAGNCIDCHMPRVSPQPPLQFTNHWIGIYGDGAKLRPIASN